MTSALADNRNMASYGLEGNLNQFSCGFAITSAALLHFVPPPTLSQLVTQQLLQPLTLPRLNKLHFSNVQMQNPMSAGLWLVVHGMQLKHAWTPQQTSTCSIGGLTSASIICTDVLAAFETHACKHRRYERRGSFQLQMLH